MIDIPKLKYKKGIVYLNPDNLFDVKGFQEAEELFYVSINDVKRHMDIKERVSSLFFSMSLTMGDWISWDYLLELLEYLGLTLKDLDNYILNSKKINFWRVDSIKCRWYLELKKEAYGY